jgi:hypothetical protein
LRGQPSHQQQPDDEARGRTQPGQPRWSAEVRGSSGAFTDSAGIRCPRDEKASTRSKPPGARRTESTIPSRTRSVRVGVINRNHALVAYAREPGHSVAWPGRSCRDGHVPLVRPPGPVRRTGVRIPPPDRRAGNCSRRGTARIRNSSRRSYSCPAQAAASPRRLWRSPDHPRIGAHRAEIRRVDLQRGGSGHPE